MARQPTMIASLSIGRSRRAFVLCSRRTSQVPARRNGATENEGTLPAFFLARIADGGVASTLGVCVHSS